MVRIFCLSLVLAFTVSPALAGFDLPKKCFTLDKLDEASAEAVKRGRPLAFLLSDTETTCGLCAGASRAMIEELDRDVVFVYVPRNEKSKVPKTVSAAFNSPEAGKFIPKLAITDVAAEEVLVVVPYESVKNDAKETFRNAEKKVREYTKRLKADGPALR